MDKYIYVLDGYSFLKFYNGTLEINGSPEILLPSSIISDILYASFLRKKEVDFLYDKFISNYSFQEMNSQIFYHQYYIKTKLEIPTKKIRDNFILPFALGIYANAKVFTSSYMDDKFYNIPEIDSVFT